MTGRAVRRTVAVVILLAVSLVFVCSLYAGVTYDRIYGCGLWYSSVYGTTQSDKTAVYPLPTLFSGVKSVAVDSNPVIFVVKDTGELFVYGRISNTYLASSLGVSYGSRVYDYKIQQFSGVKKVAVGNNGSSTHYHVLLENGDIYGLGDNYAGVLGDGTTTSRSNFVKVQSAPSNVIDISVGYSHVLALTSTGEVYAWGYNYYGQLGNGTTTSSYTPVKVTGLPNDVIAISAGSYHSLALTSSGDVYAWGDNYYGQLGDGTTTKSSTPKKITTISGIVQISAGYGYSLAVASNGDLYVWGRNDYYQLGLSTNQNKNVPTKNTYISGVEQAQAGIYNTRVLTSSKIVYAFGKNNTSYGTLCNTSSNYFAIPTPISVPSGVVNESVKIINSNVSDDLLIVGQYTSNINISDISCSSESVYPGQSIDCSVNASVDEGYSISYLWNITEKDGSSSGGVVESYTGDNSGSSATIKVVGEGTPKIVKVIANSSNNFDIVAKVKYIDILPIGLTVSSVVCPDAATINNPFICEVNASKTSEYGTIGYEWSVPGGTVNVSENKAAITYSSGGEKGLSVKVFIQEDPTIYQTISKGIHIITEGENDYTIENSNVFYGAGNNGYYQLADGTSTTRYTFTLSKLISKSVVKIVGGVSHALALTSTGEVYAWGNNSYGQLGNGSSSTQSTPVKINISNVVDISAGSYHSLALTSTGEVYAWGYNNYGQLGDGTTTNKSTPTRVIGLPADVVKVVAGYSHSLALTSSGDIYAWGYNYYGQLGNGTTSNSYTPVKVTGLTISAIGVTAGEDYSLALMSSGEVYAWGKNSNGQLGDGTTTNRYTPTKVTGLPTDVVKVTAGSAHSLALTSSGSIYAWGYNYYGQLGDGTTNASSVPKQVSSLSGVKDVESSYQSVYAISQDNKLYAWGYNSNGQLGDGSSSNRSTPTLINMSNVKSLSKNYGYFEIINAENAAIKINSITCNPNQVNPGENVSCTAQVTVSSGYTANYKWDIRGQDGNISGQIVLNNGSSATIRVDVNGENRIYLTACTNENANLCSYGVYKVIAGQVININIEGIYCSDSSIYVGQETTCDVIASVDEGYTLGYEWSTGGNMVVISGSEDVSVTIKALSSGDGQINVRVYVVQSPTVSKSKSTTVQINGNSINDLVVGCTPEVPVINQSFTCTVSASATYGSLSYDWYVDGEYVATGDEYTTQRDTEGTILLKVNAKINEDPSTVSSIEMLLYINDPNTYPDGVNVYSAGQNDYGQLGIGYKSDYIITVPQKVLVLPENIKKLVTYGRNSYAITDDGKLFVWGANGSSFVPVPKLLDVQGVVDIVVNGPSSNTYILTSSGDVFLLNFDTVSKVNGLQNVVSIVAGYQHMFALTSTGDVYAWGVNNVGQLGLGDTVDRDSPTKITSISNVEKIIGSGCRDVSFAIASNGKLYGWGSSSLIPGAPSGNVVTTPIEISLEGISDIKCWYDSSNNIEIVAKKSNGELLKWSSGSPPSVQSVNISEPIDKMWASQRVIFVKSSYGNIYAWGNSTMSVYNTDSTPKLISELSNAYVISEGNSEKTIIFAVNAGQKVVPPDLEYLGGPVYGAGNNSYYQLGVVDGSTLSPVKINSSPYNTVKVVQGSYRSYALTSSGSVYVWGRVKIQGNFQSVATPFKIAGIPVDESVVDIDASSGTLLALTDKGNVYTYGANDNYLLGIGQTSTVYDVDYFVKVSIPEKVIKISIGGDHAMVISETNKVYGWGKNGYSQITADGTTIDKPSPVLVNNVSAADISAGYAYTLMLSTTGTAYAWGYNIYGQLGTGDYSNKATPTIISNQPSGIRSVHTKEYLSAIITNSGELYTFGMYGTNDYGGACTGQNTGGITPYKVNISKTVKKVAVSNNSTLILTDDGEVYGCGKGDRIGAGTTNIYYVPTKINIGFVEDIGKNTSEYHSLYISPEKNVLISELTCTPLDVYPGQNISCSTSVIKKEQKNLVATWKVVNTDNSVGGVVVNQSVGDNVANADIKIKGEGTPKNIKVTVCLEGTNDCDDSNLNINVLQVGIKVDSASCENFYTYKSGKCSATASKDAEYGTIVYSWTVEDGTIVDNKGNEIDVVFTKGTVKNVNVRAYISEDDSVYAEKTIQANVEDTVINADFSCNPEYPYMTQEFECTATASVQWGTLDYKWSLEDKGNFIGDTVKSVYSNEGSKLISLLVTLNEAPELKKQVVKSIEIKKPGITVNSFNCVDDANSGDVYTYRLARCSIDARSDYGSLGTSDWWLLGDMVENNNLSVKVKFTDAKSPTIRTRVFIKEIPSIYVDLEKNINLIDSTPSIFLRCYLGKVLLGSTDKCLGTYETKWGTPVIKWSYTLGTEKYKTDNELWLLGDRVGKSLITYLVYLAEEPRVRAASSIEIEVTDYVPPKVKAWFNGPMVVEQDKEYTYTASVQGTEGINVKLRWEINGETFDDVEQINYTFKEAGKIPVILKAWNEGYEDESLITKVEKYVTVIEYKCPDFTIHTFTKRGYAPYVGRFAALPSRTLRSIDSFTYEWDFGDGVVLSGSNYGYVAHKFETPGEYEVKLKVTDKYGTEKFASIPVIVDSPPPMTITLKITYYGKYRRAPVYVDVKPIIYGGNLMADPIVSGTWEVNGAEVSKKFYRLIYRAETSGVYDVKLTLVTKSGKTVEGTGSFEVFDNVPPVCDFTYIDYPKYKVTRFIPDCKDEDGKITGYYWDFGNGTTSLRASPYLITNNGGDYNVTLKAFDDSGASTEITKTVTLRR